MAAIVRPRPGSTKCFMASGWRRDASGCIPMPMPIDSLPEGAMVAIDDASYLIAGGRAREWTEGGYRNSARTLS